MRVRMQGWLEAHGVEGKPMRACFRRGPRIIIDIAVFLAAIALAGGELGALVLWLEGR